MLISDVLFAAFGKRHHCARSPLGVSLPPGLPQAVCPRARIPSGSASGPRPWLQLWRLRFAPKSVVIRMARLMLHARRREEESWLEGHCRTWREAPEPS